MAWVDVLEPDKAVHRVLRDDGLAPQAEALDALHLEAVPELEWELIGNCVGDQDFFEIRIDLCQSRLMQDSLFLFFHFVGVLLNGFMYIFCPIDTVVARAHLTSD